MPEFIYKARDRRGKLVTGKLEQSSEEACAAELRRLGLTPVTIIQKKESVLGKGIRLGKIKLEDLTMFTNQLHSLLRAGVPLLLALRAILDQTRNKTLEGIIKEVMKDVEAGKSFADALEKYHRCFPEVYIGMIRNGEAAGIMDEVLARLSELLEYELSVRNKVKNALFYPVLVISAMVIASYILITIVIPRFARVFSQFNMPLPLPTRILIWINYVVTNYGVYIMIGLIVLVIAFIRYIHTKRGRQWWDGIKLKIPIVGNISYRFIMSRFARTSALLVRAGLPIIQVLDLTSRSIGNVVIAGVIDEIRKNVSEGKGISEPMRISGLFPPVVVQMVSIGEETGNLDQLLLSVSEYYDRQLDYIIKNLTTLIEPIVLLILASGVLFMALAIFLPMWNLVHLFRG